MSVANAAVWEESPLADFCRPKQWPTIPKNQLSEEGFPVFGANGLIGYHTEYNHESPTLLITCRGATCGTLNICPPKCYVTGNAMALNELAKDRVDLKFLFYALNRRGLRDAITGSAQPQITRQSLQKVKVKLPPLLEQKRIAGILDKADSIRRKRQQAIGLTEQFLRSTFLDMFGDPVTNPKGWPTEKMENVVDMVTGFAFKSKEYVEDGIKLCRGANVLPDEVDWSDVRFWSASEAVDEKLHLRLDDVVLAMDRPWISSGLKVAQISEADLPSYLVQRVSRLRGIEGISNAFLYYSIRHPAFTKHCGGLKTETTVPHISSDNIRSYELPVAPPKVHSDFDKVVNVARAKLGNQVESLVEKDNLFNSLVQRAFRGEL